MASIVSMSSCRVQNAVTTTAGRLLFSTKNTNGSKLGPLPSSSSPAKAKARYLESKHEADKYLDPHEKILQLNKEIELVREQAAEKLEKELKKSVWKKLSDPLVKHKHSLYNVFAMTLAYLLAHNLFVTSKQEKQARAELTESQETNADLKRILDYLLEESTLQEMGSACARQFNQETKQNKTNNRSVWWPGIGSIAKQTEQGEKDLEAVFTSVLKKELELRIGDVTVSEEERKQLSIEEIMQQNQESVKALNENPELLLLQALESAEDDDIAGKKQRRVFSM
jgi:hypothetical protein